MRSDGVETREALVRAAQRLFATKGLEVSTLEIREAAGQRNRNAVAYYFGSREGLVAAVVDAEAAAVNARRRRMLDGLDHPVLSDFVAALVVPLADCLLTTEGRYHLLIVQQLLHHIARGGEAVPVDPAIADTMAGLRRSIGGRGRRVEARVALAPVMAAAMMADRARQIEAGQPTAVSHREFVEMVTQLITGALASKPSA